MTHVVTDACINCKHTDCVEVCPVDCFYEGPNFLAIHPDECIDCGVCIPECPEDAILADTDKSVSSDDMDFWIKLNQELADQWDVITEKKPAMPDYEKWQGVENKIIHLQKK